MCAFVIMWDMFHALVSPKFVICNLYHVMTVVICVGLYYCFVVTCLHLCVVVYISSR